MAGRVALPTVNDLFLPVSCIESKQFAAGQAHLAVGFIPQPKAVLFVNDDAGLASFPRQCSQPSRLIKNASQMFLLLTSARTGLRAEPASGHEWDLKIPTCSIQVYASC